jgi:hypothetical protein
MFIAALFTMAKWGNNPPTCLSTEEQVNKTGHVLLNLKRGRESDTCYNVEKTLKHRRK